MNTLQNPSLYRDGNNWCFRYDIDGKRKFATVCPVEGKGALNINRTARNAR